MDTKTYIVKCPHCGAEKRVAYSPNSWTKSVYTFWSDSRIESDEWCEPAHTQRCPSCGEFFTLPNKSNLQKEDKPCNDTGLLSYENLKIAIEELSGDEHAEEWARLEAWWAFNSKYQHSDNIPEEEVAFNKSNMQWLVDFYNTRMTRFSHLLFELNRLLGNCEVCEKMIEQLTYEEYVKQREKRNREKGFTSQLGATSVRELYDSLMGELRYSLTQPLKTYLKSH